MEKIIKFKMIERIVNLRNIALFALTLLIGGSIGSAGGSSRAVKDTLILCNQRPHECKFKYDILMYEQDGRVPYVDPTKVKPETEKK
jgi:hypothetical protein